MYDLAYSSYVSCSSLMLHHLTVHRCVSQSLKLDLQHMSESWEGALELIEEKFRTYSSVRAYACVP